MSRFLVHLNAVLLTCALGAVATVLWAASQPYHPGRLRPQPMSRAEIDKRTQPAVQAEPAPKLYPVWVNGKTGFIDSAGRLVIPLRTLPFNVWEEFSDGMARISVSTQEQPGYCCRFGYINAEGRVVVEPQYLEAEDFSEGLAAVKAGDRWGYIDREGRMALGPKWIAAHSFSEGLAAVAEEGGGQGYIDRTGEMVIRLRAETAPREFHEGMAVVVVAPADSTEGGYLGKDGQFGYGYVDRTGRLAVPGPFEKAEDFSEGLAAVKVKGRWGYIDKTGRVAIKPRFDAAGKFTGGIARVLVGWINADVPQTRARNGYIDKAGKYVWRPSR